MLIGLKSLVGVGVLIAAAFGFGVESYFESPEVVAHLAPMPAVVCPKTDDEQSFTYLTGWRWQAKYEIYHRTKGCKLFMDGRQVDLSNE